MSKPDIPTNWWPDLPEDRYRHWHRKLRELAGWLLLALAGLVVITAVAGSPHYVYLIDVATVLAIGLLVGRVLRPGR
jgi:hypothetical protein